jgi:PAS domain S-box-containing protein
MTRTNNKLIVLAEDSTTQAVQIKHFLQKAGYSVLHGVNGQEALDFIKGNKPNMVISDILMPALDGYELCECVKSDEDLKEIPVILLTSLTEPTDIIRGLNCGANNFITKPFIEKELLSRVNNIFTNIELRQHSYAEFGVEIYFAGKKFHITSDRMQILDLLLSSYESSIQKSVELKKANQELFKTKKKLESLNKDLEQEVEKRSKRILRLNSLLEAIRQINRLIAKEQDPQELLQKACDSLHNIRGYQHVFIISVDEEGNALHTAQKGPKSRAAKLHKNIEKGIWPVCSRSAMSQEDLFVQGICGEACKDCPLYDENTIFGNHSIKLVHDNRVFGILSIQQYAEFVHDEEEHDLIVEVAGDLGFALNDMMLAKEHAFANSELRKRTNDLTKSETNLRRAQHVANIGSWEYDIGNDKLTWAEETYRIFGLNPYEFTPSYQGLLELIHPDDRDYFNQSFQDSVKNSTESDITHRIIRPDGEYWYVNVRSEVIRDDSDNTIRSIGTVQDITDRVFMEQQLVQARETAEKADGLKTSFLMNMSHEIRTPMNAIIGFSDLLTGPELDEPDRSKFGSIIKENGQRLLHLIDDILDISKIETGQLVIKKQEVRLNRIVGELIETYNILIQKGSKAPIEIIYGENSDTNLKVFTDPNRLRQILSNLIENAVKNTEKGSVEIGYYLVTSEKENENRIVIYVKDTGRGIAPEDLESIFELFRKIESKDKLFEGIGLGLSISKNLVHLLGGEISVKSEPGGGSEFSFWLPLKKSEQPDILKTFQPNLTFQSLFDDKVVLVAEDEVGNFSLMKFAFKGTGAKLIHAEDGRKAVNICNTNIDIDIVLMDIKMPELDGFAATRIIKKQRKDLPVIALTAFAMEDDIKSCFEAGCDEFQAKPVNFDELFGKIEKCLKKQY